MSSRPAPPAPAPAGDLSQPARLSALARELADAAGDAAALDATLAQRLRAIAGELEDEAAAGQGDPGGLEAVMDARDAIVSADESGRILFFSAGAEAMFGWTSSEVLGRPLEMLMPERYRAAHRAGLARHAATGATRAAGRTAELEGMRRDGEEFPIELSLGTTTTDGRRAFTAVVRDTSERAAARRRLHIAEEQFAQAFGGATMGLALLGADGRFLKANPALAELSGHTEQELGDLRLMDLVHPDDREPLRSALDAMAGGLTDRHVGEHRWLRRDGSVAHLRSHAGLVRAADGRPQHYVLTLEDVTERRRMLEALTLSEARHRALVENLPDTVIALFDADLRLLVVEGGGLERLRRTPAEVEGRLLAEILECDGPAAVEASNRAALEANHRAALLGEGRSFDFEDAGGVTWWMQVAPMYDEGRRVIGGMAVWRDVSHRKAAERSLQERAAELERSNAELEQFAYVASHDLAEPLRMVTSYLHLLQRRYEGRLDDDADDFIRHALDGATRMRALIDDLLTYSRTGRGEVRRETVDTAALVERMAATLTAGREGPAATIHVGDLPHVQGDPAQLGQLFQNLLGNALKFTPPDRAPEIEVRADARTDGPGWVFTVADNGIGFDPEHADRIFRMFQRLHARDDYPGTGVGLAIARKVVERHGGRIWAEPRPGGGARFRFELPGTERSGPA